MKNTLKTLLIGIWLLSFSAVQAQSQADYQSLWKRVETFKNDGRTASALALVDQIYNSAKGDERNDQRIKAVFHRAIFTGFKEEKAFEKTLIDFESELEISDVGSRAILHSAMAELYWWYYSGNRWKILERSTANSIDSADIGTWSAGQIMQKVNRHYQLSLKEKVLLHKIDPSDYDLIWETGNKGRIFRPSLYDILAWRAIEFYTNTETGLPKPADQFILEGEQYYAEATSFMNIDLGTSDTSSFLYIAIGLIQDLTRSHLESSNMQALSYVNFERVKLVHRLDPSSNSDSLFLSSLRMMLLSSKGEIASLIMHERALYYYRQGSKYNALQGVEHRWEKKKSMEICLETMKEYSEYTGAGLCHNLKNQLEEKSISLNTESVVVPGKAFIGSLQHANVNKVYYRVIERVDKMRHSSARRYKDDINEILELTASITGEFNLMDTLDYQQHRTELSFPALKKGFYTILISLNEDFSGIENLFSVQEVWSSGLAYFQTTENSTEAKLYAVNRKSGEPIKGVVAELYLEEYNYQNRGQDLIKNGTYVTDENGSVTLKAQGSNQAFRVMISHQGDSLLVSNQIYLRKHRESTIKTSTQSFIFTDRKIYRPGQLVYFKGIVLERQGLTVKVLPKKRFELSLIDANNTPVGKIALETDEFGAYQGTFPLPSGGLSGQYRLSDGASTHYISVEEYKRPSFRIEADSMKGSYRLGETVRISGKAENWNGIPLQLASGTFRISRQQMLAYSSYYGFRPFPSTSPTEISQGSFKTDQNGKWIIDFKASSDRSKKKESETYYFNVELIITDVNEESQKMSINIPVSNRSLFLSLNTKDQMELNEADTLLLSTTNLQGSHVGALVEVEVFKLVPGPIRKTRLWPAPDYYSYSRENFMKLHPFDPYWQNKGIAGWSIEKLLFKKTVNTQESKLLNLGKAENMEQGAYLIRLKSTDEHGQPVDWEGRVVLFDKGAKSLPSPTILWVKALKDTYKVGETAEVLIGSSIKNAKVLYSVRTKKDLIKEEWLTLKDGVKKIAIQVSEEHRGNFGLQFLCVLQGRIYEDQQLISVPYDNKELKIKLLTFRSELKPGEEVSWKINVSSPGTSSSDLSVLASMYDMSLDAFAPNHWTFNPYYNYYPVRPYFSGNNFKSSFGRNYPFFDKDYKNIEPLSFDRLNWFGFSYYGSGIMMFSRSDNFETTGAELSDDAIYTNGKAATSEIRGSRAKVPEALPPAATEQLSEVPLRRNFNETAFFYPDLRTDDQGNASIEFNTPDALTRWYFQALVQSQDLEIGLISKEIVTKKEVMVLPNLPRFLMTGDTIELSAKLVNLSGEAISGSANLSSKWLLDDGRALKILSDSVIPFLVKANSTAKLSWKVSCPDQTGLLAVSISASSPDHRDGEERILPVLNSKVLMNDTYPVSLRPGQKKTFNVKELEESTSNQKFRYTLEMTGNPLWYVVKALPYMADKGNESSEQAFSRYFANSLAYYLISKNDVIRDVFQDWKSEPIAFQSKLDQNPELKQLLLNESPWMTEAKEEVQAMTNLANFFDANSLEHSLNSTLRELIKKQSPNGGWPWFSGMRDNRFITQHIVSGLGKMDHLGVTDIRKDAALWTAMQLALNYLDERMREDYERILKHQDGRHYLGALHIQYLYARSFYTDVPINEKSQKAFDYFLELGREHWLDQGKYLQAILAVVYLRRKELETSSMILTSLKENALYSDEFGMYWKAEGGYYWHQSDLLRQTALIEAFDEAGDFQKDVEEMKIWLLKQKQTRMWKNSLSTTNACFALLSNAGDDLRAKADVRVRFSEEVFEVEESSKMAGTGYYKKAWSGNEIKRELAKVEVENKGGQVSWGAIYYQYFKEASESEEVSAGLSIHREFYKKVNTPKGPSHDRIADSTVLHSGDVVLVRLIVKTDRELEFVSIKDMRSAGLEPLETISSYRYQSGLGYYQSVLDASHNFFIDRMDKGSYVIEYELKTNNKGNFSAGFSAAQCFYAPEFSARSAGTRLLIR
ncbi:MAG: alpha-2-macroglobulin family protein [Vicingaceae bacterium]